MNVCAGCATNLSKISNMVVSTWAFCMCVCVVGQMGENSVTVFEWFHRNRYMFFCECVCVCVSPSLLLALGIIFCFRSMTLWQFLFLFGLLNGEHTQLHNETTNNSYLSSCCTAVLYSAVMCCVQTMICRSNEIYCVCARAVRFWKIQSFYCLPSSSCSSLSL